MAHPEREYGFGDSSLFVRGTPRVVEKAEGLPACPGCGCTTLYLIEVNVEMPLLKGGKGMGRYVGCPACPFASPMMMTAGQ